MVLDTPMTYIDESIFGKPQLKTDLYHHFGSDAKISRVRKARELEKGSNGELINGYLLEVSSNMLGVYCFLFLVIFF